MYFDIHEMELINKAISKYPEKKAALLDILHIVQDKELHISDDASKAISEILEMPKKDVDGVVSFYTMFTTKPRGKHHIQVCTNVSCMLMKGKELFEYVSNKTGLKNNETSADGLYSLEEVECMGACGSAPMIAVNERYYDNVSKEVFDTIFDSLI
ncbi:MAG: NAD(P)H-dependent oxidoreductase subunit E [bacterium]